MTTKNPNIALLMGGPSTEHKISLLSGNSIYKAIDKNKYNVFVVGIDHDTKWWLYETENFLENAAKADKIILKSGAREVFVRNIDGKVVLMSANGEILKDIDLFFPVLHGSYGEDGVLQGVFQSVGAAYTGVGLMASSVGMDKDLAKRIWRDAGIPVADFICLKKHEKSSLSFEEIKQKLGLPVFVKPANAGSSVGVSKVTSEDEYYLALDEAFRFDTKILIEEAVIGKEVECAVLGNEYPKASVMGEIIPKATFYSYEAKYLDDDGASMAIPANIDQTTSESLRNLAVRAFQTIGCEGLARVDFFLTSEGKMVLNEINTLPGFTSISMYPKLWEATGLPYTQLIDEIITLGLQRYKRDVSLVKRI
jgi:D-alanine-D-alanine ligase